MKKGWSWYDYFSMGNKNANQWAAGLAFKLSEEPRNIFCGLGFIQENTWVNNMKKTSNGLFDEFQNFTYCL